MYRASSIYFKQVKKPSVKPEFFLFILVIELHD